MHYFNHIEMLCETRYYCLTIKLDLKFIVDLAKRISAVILVSIFDEHICHSDHCFTTNTPTEIFIIYCHRNHFDSEQAFIDCVEFHGRLQTETHEKMKRSHRNAV